jgi:glucose-1-phosphate cytidylyltransferase
MTGGRLLQAKEHLESEFYFTYGDGLSDVDLHEVYRFHSNHKLLATVTATRPTSRFGELLISKSDLIGGQGGLVRNFQEKRYISSDSEEHFISGGFFILKKSVLEFIHDDSTIFEKEPLESLTKIDQLAAFQHKGFWQPMDTLRDAEYLRELWASGNAPWKKW